MAVGFKVGFYWYRIGRGDFLTSFFSTVAFRLEGNKWGERFPVIMNKLYWGRLDKSELDEAIRELGVIRDELEKLDPDQVIWDIEDLSKQPPWGKEISADITNMANYYVTSGGDDFLTIFLYALRSAKKLGVDMEIESI